MTPSTRRFSNRNGQCFPSEELPENKLDKDVQTIFFPLNLMQLIVLNPKCRIKNNFLHPNNCLNKIILFSAMVIYLATYIYKLLDVMLDEIFIAYMKIHFLYIITYFDFFVYCSGFILNFIINLTKTKNMVDLILSYQKVNRILKDESLFKGSVHRSWMYVGATFSFHIFTMSFSTLASFQVVFNTTVLISLDANLIYTITVIKLLSEKVILWNARIAVVSESDCNDMYYQKMFGVYVNLLKCYDLVKDVFQQQILYQTIVTFSRCLVNVQVAIEFHQFFLLHAPNISLYLYSGMVKTLIIQLVLSLKCQAFYDAVQNSEDTCEHILVTCHNDDKRRVCKNVQRLIRSSFTKINACGLFIVDINQPLQLMILLTNHIVMLLQFAFLK